MRGFLLAAFAPMRCGCDYLPKSLRAALDDSRPAIPNGQELHPSRRGTKKSCIREKKQKSWTNYENDR
jgi:hypothetical protein